MDPGAAVLRSVGSVYDISRTSLFLVLLLSMVKGNGTDKDSTGDLFWLSPFRRVSKTRMMITTWV